MKPPFPPAIFLMGPTATGKTDAAIYLTQHVPCEIISVDSALVYRGLDIGSAKPDAQTLVRAPHRLINICDPSQPYSVAEFRVDALAAMAGITAAGKIPLLVGGTMLYFKALRDGLADLPETDDAVRAGIAVEAKKIGWPAMHSKLAEVDPITAARLHPNHSQRIGRALEVYLMTGEPLSVFHARQEQQVFPYRLLQLALIPEEREWLYQRIDLRFDQMIEQGFLSEVEALYHRGDLHKELPAIRSVGYRQAWEYLEEQVKAVEIGESLTREQMIERAKMASRQLAKRQLTWLRNWPDLQAIPIGLKTIGSKPAGLQAQAGSIVGANCLQAVNAFLYPQSSD